MKALMKGQRGFTLVELMVSVALLGLIMTVIYSLFATTSNSLREADSLANTIDRSRFAIEHVATSIRSAGSFGSPDSAQDPWVKPDRGTTIRMLGVSSYTGWQNQTGLIDAAGLDAAHDSDGDGNPEISFDGIIVMGAIDFPQSFEISNLNFAADGRVDAGWIPANERGLFKLIVNDPFYTDIELPPGLDLSSGATDSLVRDLQNRLIRVMDHNGYIQISGITATNPVPSYQAGASIPGTIEGGVEFGLSTPWLVRNNQADDAAADDSEFGLEPPSVDDDDIGYDAALIDAYWYYVEAVPDDPGNFRLVRERLNAQALATALAAGPDSLSVNAADGSLTGTGGTAVSALATGGATDREKVVITERVADFQVWFDCADNNGNVAGAAWQMKWANPGGGDCMDPDGSAFREARMAHVRLSVRTEQERAEAPDTAESFFMDEETAEVGDNVPLRYFNVYPDAPGAARVVTMQTDIELTNFATRNLAAP